MATIAAAYPFIVVNIDTSALTPIAQRSPGVIAIVGKTPDGAAGGTAGVDTPFEVDTTDDVNNLFAGIAGSVVTDTTLSLSLKTAMLQDPAPSKIYGVRVSGDDYASALASLEAVDDVDFVSLAGEVSVGAPSSTTSTATDLTALKEHVESVSAQGGKRIGVAMIDPSILKSNTYAADVTALVNPLLSDVSRMVMIAARGATTDAASAAMAAIAGYAPQVSMVLKSVNNVSAPVASQYSPSEIKQLSEANIIPIIQSSLIVGGGFYFGEGRTFTTDADLLYIDIVRVLDDIDFRLKAGLIGMIGDARITKSGLTQIKLRFDEILAPLVQSAEIADYSVSIPVLDILARPESTWSPADAAAVATARANRTVDAIASITYGPAVHRLVVTLAPQF